MKIIVALLFISLLTACTHKNMDRPEIKEVIIPALRKDPKPNLLLLTLYPEVIQAKSLLQARSVAGRGVEFNDLK